MTTSVSKISNAGNLYEDATQRLQKGLDDYTKLLEKEKRHLQFLEDQHKEKMDKLKKMKEILKQKRPSTPQQKKNVAILKVLENKLDQAIVRYNEITSKNGQLRHQIDLLRKDIYTSREVQRKLEEKIGKIKKTAVTKNTNTNKLQTNTESINVQVMVLQQKYNKDKEEFKFEMNKLVSQLKEKDESRVIEEKGQSMEMTKTKSIIKGKGDFTNPLEIINMRLTNWKARNRDKKRIIDNYLRNVNILKDAFEEIQKTTGIGTIEEIVTTFIKSEEQNYSLYNYANNLGQECDSFEDQNKRMENEIKRREGGSLKTEKEMQEKKKVLEAQKKECMDAINSKKAEIERGEESIKRIQDPFVKIMSIFKDCPLSILVSEKLNYSSETIFNTQTIKQYLAEAEEYITTYITLVAEKNNIENPLVSSMPLDKIRPKKENEPDLKLSELQDNNLNTKNRLAIDENSEDMWNPSKLYKTVSKKYQEAKTNSIPTEEEKDEKKDQPKEAKKPSKEAQPSKDQPKSEQPKEELKKEVAPEEATHEAPKEEPAKTSA